MAGYKNYAKMSIQTADPRAVIVLLYEGAINFLNQSLAALEKNDRMGMSVQISKAQRIIHHLASALDFDRGEEIAQNLAKLYTYMRDALSEASIQCDAGKVQEVIDLIRPLLDAWQQLAKDPSMSEVSQSPSNVSITSTKGEEPLSNAPSNGSWQIGDYRPTAAPTEEPRVASGMAAISGSPKKARAFAMMAESILSARPASGFSESV